MDVLRTCGLVAMVCAPLLCSEDGIIANWVLGKHDVGSLSHAPRHGGVGTGSVSGSLMGRHGHHGHSHAHPPVAEPMSTSSRPRRGE